MSDLLQAPSRYVSGQPNPSTDIGLEGVEDPYYKGYAAELAAPLTGSTQKQTAGGVAPDQINRSFPNEIVSPTNTDIAIYTVPLASSTLTAAIQGSTTPQLISVASTANFTPGPFLIDTTETVYLIAVASTTQFWGIANKSHANSATVVSTGRSFLPTDFEVTTSAASGFCRLKARTTATSGAISAGANTVTFANPDYSLTYGDITYIGQFVYIEDPSSGVYELVKVTAVTRNASGIITGFTGTFVNAHGANFPIAFPMLLAGINSTKGIEIVGQETQPHCPSGMQLVVHYGAQGGTVMQNLFGYEQP